MIALSRLLLNGILRNLMWNIKLTWLIFIEESFWWLEHTLLNIRAIVCVWYHFIYYLYYIWVICFSVSVSGKKKGFQFQDWFFEKRCSFMLQKHLWHRKTILLIVNSWCHFCDFFVHLSKIFVLRFKKKENVFKFKTTYSK